MKLAAFIIAIVLFLLAAAGAHPFDVAQSDMIAFGLAFLGLGLALPR